MKTQVLIVSLLFGGLSLFAQLGNTANNPIADQQAKEELTTRTTYLPHQTEAGTTMAEDKQLSHVITTDENSSNFEKTEYTYDDQGNVNSVIIKQWNGADWINSRKKEFTNTNYEKITNEYTWYKNQSKWLDVSEAGSIFDNKGRLIQKYHYSAKNPETQEWFTRTKDEFEFDDQDRITQKASYSWFRNGWIGTLKTRIIINEKGELLSSEVYDGWDYNNSSWRGLEKKDYTYDSSGQLLSLTLLYSWDETSNTWGNGSKTERTYDEDHRIISEDKYTWFSTTQKWVISAYTKDTYDSFGRKIHSINLGGWNNTNNTWANGAKSETIYDENHNITLETIFRWNSGIQQWEGSSYQEAQYDSFRRQTLFIRHSLWNSTNNTWDSGSKFETKYDENHNITLNANYNWNAETQQWGGRNYEEYEFDDLRQKTLSIIFSGWDDTNNTWSSGSKTESEYDENHNTILRTNYTWNANTQQWKKDSHEENIYDNFGRLTSSIILNGWDETNNTWNLYGSKIETKYNENHIVVLDANYNWDIVTQQWAGSYYSERGFDELKRTILSVDLYGWDDTNNTWGSGSKTEREYDENHNLILEAYYSWDSSTSSWIGGSKNEHKYDKKTNEQTLNASYNSWDTETNSWIGLRKQEKQTTEDGLPLLDASYEWDTLTKDWKETSFKKWTYDERNNLKTYEDDENKQKYEYTYDLSNSRIEESKTFEWEQNSNSYELKHVSTYFYSDLVGIDEALARGALVCYPNPVKEGFYVKNLTIDNAPLRLLNMSGQTVKETTISNDELVDISTLPQGIYIVTIETPANTLQQEIVKK